MGDRSLWKLTAFTKILFSVSDNFVKGIDGHAVKNFNNSSE